ncbi:unnamed protein product [Pleuronectes platessa]|uniref:Uncharacterized protein n=1 Tax=Pleuronectes platessa TaxID=8262 RepID=A0A9N7U6D9_PLEPL|nr:unnamed protein product [Pleuronectes platessa]
MQAGNRRVETCYWEQVHTKPSAYCTGQTSTLGLDCETYPSYGQGGALRDGRWEREGGRDRGRDCERERTERRTEKVQDWRVWPSGDTQELRSQLEEPRIFDSSVVC